ncbi:2-phosphosulfolactate phosphatase family protein [Gloeocapsa sp. PCC 73106]|uniref:2-phosphosulfolactate phosphatase family protein n=1 Tax=Gloeocapsa sp. PCC 73106 TaxID=102232 RepID=UPI0002ABB8E8|nr:2-phosphosulfolactate phosphatase family protein [Gloeocapsa sp. PCC 73106]ELR98219.1 phosphosulfolactate phosphohydrolase-like enzyme [Gloeocapsa sp. PCC 73106]
MKLFVYHTPELSPKESCPDCAVVIDVLRATTTIATALNAGAEAVQAFSDLEQLMQVSAEWPSQLRLKAGERGGAKVAGCDLGNSPLDCVPDVVKDKRLFISTTNGTRALERVRESKIVMTAALVNRRAAVKYILKKEPGTVWLLGSGWEGGYSLEDTVCAGAIAQALLPQYQVGNDEVIAAIALYDQWKDNLLHLFEQSSHGQRLLGLNAKADLAYCAQTDILDILPIQSDPGVLVPFR